MNFPFYRQANAMDCGPSCLRMVSKYHGRSIGMEKLRNAAGLGKEGVSMLGIAEAAEKIGLKTVGVQISFQQLINDAALPAILHWNQNHFIVVTPKADKRTINIADPGKGILSYTREEFCRHWISSRNENGEGVGIALLLEPTPDFFEQPDEQEKKMGWSMLAGYLRKYRRYFFQIALSLLLGSMIQLAFPFLTKSIVDTGIATQNLSFITIILLAQLMLFLGRTTVEFIRSRLLLHISTRINIAILSDFWIKLMRLPMSYFDARLTGDTLQRIEDHKRIETFLTGTALSTAFSVFNLFVFSIVLLTYSSMIFFVFAGASLLYFLWISFFLRFRRKLDYQRFEIASKENSATMQLIHGMQEIKLQTAEHRYRWQWENIQTRLFRLSFKSLSLSQYQQAGGFFINEGKNILITFMAAQLVINGQQTLGVMLAIQYIIGQLNSPVEQLINFMQSAQDARISLNRLSHVHDLDDEEPAGRGYLDFLSENKTLQLSRVSYTYPGAGNSPVLKNISLQIPQGKTSAIVGVSGSGKTTLLKLLLRFYEGYSGEIRVGNINLATISPRFWRQQCGSVMQDGFIFNDTIAGNIAISDTPDYGRLLHACKVANILQFIESLPLGLNTKIGAEGHGISAGQKQRLLIARTVYKNPDYIFFDEATNALDANNEKEILDNLEGFFKEKTVVVVAHRLSTVKKADHIIVLHEGEIAESGTHEELIRLQSRYFQLIKNQLELGN